MPNIVKDANGDHILLPNGAYLLQRQSGAPNEVSFDESVYVFFSPGSTTEEVSVVFGDNITAGITHATIVWYFDGDTTSYTFEVNDTDTLYSLGPSLGIMGRHSNQTATYTIDFTNASGRGSPPNNPISPNFTEPVDPPDDDEVTVIDVPLLLTDPLEEGLPFSYMSGTYTGTPVDFIISYQVAEDGSGTGAVITPITGGLMPTDSGGSFFRRVESVTGEGIVTPGSVYGADNTLDNPSVWTEIEDVAGTQTPTPTDSEWDFHTVTDISSTATRVDIIQILDDYVAVEAQWTTADTTESDQEIEADGNWEDMSLGSTTGGYQLWNVGDVLGADGRNFRIFEPSVYPGDQARSGRFKIRIKDADGIWGASTTVKQVPLQEEEEEGYYNYGDPLPFLTRSKQQWQTNTLGGGGYQFMRSWAYSPNKPDRLFAVEDIGMPTITNDFGELWEHPACEGLKVGFSGQSCYSDSMNGDRILMIQSAGYKAGVDAWNNIAGIYVSTDAGLNFTLAQAVPDVQGSANNDTGTPNCRFMQHVFVELPGGNAAGTNREYLCLARRCPKGAANATDAQMWKSTNGGISWTLLYTVPRATTGNMITEFKRHAVDGTYFIGCSSGLLRTNNADVGSNPTWTNISSSTNLPSGFIYRIDADGASDEVWVAVENSGLYVSTDGGDTWTGKKTGYDINTFAISPHTRSGALTNRRILIAGKAGSNREIPQWSSNGGGSWTNIQTNSFPGQPGTFEHLIHNTHAYYVWHAVDPTLVFAARFQHFGVSTNSGQTFNYSSNNFDYNETNAFCADPGDWTQVYEGKTDRDSLLDVYLDEGGWVIDDNITSEDDDTIRNALGLGTTGYIGNGAGPLILRNGNHRAIISAKGNSSKRVTVVHTPTISSTARSNNTGGGSLTGLTIVGSGQIQHGTYDVVCTATAAGAGTFTITRPDGTTDTATVGVQKTSQGIRFTITDGAPDWAIGDKFTIVINILGNATVPGGQSGGASWATTTGWETGTTNIGYVGRWKYSLNSSGVLSGPTDCGKDIIGVGSTGVYYGTDKGSGNKIYRSDDGESAWTTWATVSEDFRPVTSEWVAAVDITHAGRILVGCSGLGNAHGHAILLTGTTNPTEKIVFTAEDEAAAGHPDYSVFHVVIDPNDPDIAVITLHMFGTPSIFRTENLTATTPTWTGIMPDDGKMCMCICTPYINPNTSDLHISSRHGSFIIPPPAGHVLGGDAARVYDGIWDYVKNVQL